jgi:hypothetical protein
MKRIVCFLFLLFLIQSCKNVEDNKQAKVTNMPIADDQSAAINFVQAALKGRYDEANKFMLHDSVNDERLDAVSRVQLSLNEKLGLGEAFITIHSSNQVNDSTSVIVYSNSYYKDNKDTLKVVKINGKWLVDFKYLFDHDQEVASVPIIKDSIQK